MRQDGLGGAGVVSHGQSFSFGGGDAAGQSGGGHEMVFKHLHSALQPAAQVLRSSLQWTIQGVDCGWQRHGLFQDGLRLRAFESGAGEVVEARAGVAGICLEQLAGVFEESGKALAVVAGGSVAGGVSDSTGQRSGAAASGGVSGGASGCGGWS